MKHPDTDALLQAILETLQEPERTSVQQHVSGCPECAAQMKELESQVQTITRVAFPSVEIVPPRLPVRHAAGKSILKAAAVLVLGFLMGYATAHLAEREPRSIVGQRLQPTTIPVSTTRNTPSEAIDCATLLRSPR
jgi:anti-sigma factor RsiW